MSNEMKGEVVKRLPEQTRGIYLHACLSVFSIRVLAR